MKNNVDELLLNSLEEPTLTSWTRPGAEAYVGQDHDPTWMPDMRVSIPATSSRTGQQLEADQASRVELVEEEWLMRGGDEWEIMPA